MISMSATGDLSKSSRSSACIQAVVWLEIITQLAYGK